MRKKAMNRLCSGNEAHYIIFSVILGTTTLINPPLPTTRTLKSPAKINGKCDEELFQELLKLL